jgi:hypothetical protein
MGVAQKALYNSLRLSWLYDPGMSLEPWKVEDYRAIGTDELFERLRFHDIFLDKTTLKSSADGVDSPEELVDELASAEDLDPEEYDQIYLLIFELWRRLMPEKPTISILCDELDHQIYHYAQGHKDHFEALSDALANLYNVLEENVDHGVEPQEVFSAIGEYCAQDVEHFLYDYIADQIDAKESDFAIELLEQFYPFTLDKTWFDLLRARLAALTDPRGAQEMVRKLVAAQRDTPSLELNFDILSFLVEIASSDLFTQVFADTVGLLETEEDFIELVTLAADFFRALGHDAHEQKLVGLIEKRKEISPENLIAENDPDLVTLRQLLKV